MTRLLGEIALASERLSAGDGGHAISMNVDTGTKLLHPRHSSLPTSGVVLEIPVRSLETGADQ
jgi:hypothetical protein